jgi:benzylsuccinate synthase
MATVTTWDTKSIIDDGSPTTYKGKTVTWEPADPKEKDIPIEELHENLSKPSTDRTRRLKARCRFKHSAAGEFVEKDVRAGIERMRHITESHKARVGPP